MARKRSTENPPPTLSSKDKEEEEEESEENDTAEAKQEELPVKKPAGVHKHQSDSEDDSENTIPSPNVSDFTIKPVINKPGAKRPAQSDTTAASESMKKKKERTGDAKAPTIVLGLPRQIASGKKPASKSGAKGKVRGDMIVTRQGMDKSLDLDKGKEMMDGKSKKLLEKMLEMYIKRNELVREQTKLLLEELKSEKT
ncbi:hypothetical protein ACOSP7_002574 [Xanthoceras sorbifolium]